LTALREDTSKAELVTVAPSRRQEEGGVSALLYVGLGLISVGMVITFVGLGDKGFKSMQLRMVGPGLVGLGLLFTFLRVLLCIVPPYINRCRRGRRKRSRELIANGRAVQVGGRPLSMSPPTKVAFSLPLSNNEEKRRKTQSGAKSNDKGCEEKSGRGGEGKVVDENQKHQQQDEEGADGNFSSSGSSTFSDGEEDHPPFISHKSRRARYARETRNLSSKSSRNPSDDRSRNPSSKSSNRKLSSGYDLRAVGSSTSENKDFFQ